MNHVEAAASAASSTFEATMMDETTPKIALDGTSLSDVSAYGTELMFS